ncbi:Vacuolar H+-ATPase V1 sector, subunit H [Trachipleistophora hominis]|uniref:Vacuolar H+-ATPase V1 sector, subunit H n=1 Tax=Trachipleistophora hominis TaxID=72359 RepID=L7JUU4_TRAHO|nr:Vacuolar H+-ATPase V1 sector, subunit H [Trachipleistophora hominis]
MTDNNGKGLSAALKPCKKQKEDRNEVQIGPLHDLQSADKKTRLKALYTLCMDAETYMNDIIEYFVDVGEAKALKEVNFCLVCMRKLFMERLERGTEDKFEMEHLEYACESSTDSTPMDVGSSCTSEYEIRITATAPKRPPHTPNTERFIPFSEREHGYANVTDRRMRFIKDERVRRILIAMLSIRNVQYNASIILWYVSFSKETIEYFELIVPHLLHLLKTRECEKMVRTTFFIIRNLLKNGFFFSLVTCHDIINDTANMKYEDEELKSTIDQVARVLKSRLLKTSSFQNYLRELFSGKLENTPYHFSDVFWSMNMNSLIEYKIEIIRALKKYLKSGCTQHKCVAANDLYRFVKACPEIVRIVEKFDLKTELFKLCESTNDDLRFYALQSLSVCIFQEWH